MNESDEKLRQLIAENIAYYRKLNGDTQAGLAEKLSYSDKSVSKWERGDSTPDIFILSHIASLYGITVQDLLREKKVAKTRTRHLLISLLSVGLVWLVMTVLFCGAQIFSICDGMPGCCSSTASPSPESWRRFSARSGATSSRRSSPARLSSGAPL